MSRHRIPHTLDLYRRTALNKLVGKTYFNRVLSNNKSKQKNIVISFDPDERKDLDVMPALLDELKKRKMCASFAAVGAWVEERPEIWRRVLREGHEIINHTQSHPDNAELNPKHYHELSHEERLKEIIDCHKTVERVLKHKMTGFRTPHFGYQHTEDTYEILREIKYKFSSSTLAIDAPKRGEKGTKVGEPYKVNGIVEFPLSPCPKHPWALFDSSHAFRGRFLKHTPKEFIENFETLIESGLPLNIYLDPQDFDKFDFRELLNLIVKKKLVTKRYADLL